MSVGLSTFLFPKNQSSMPNISDLEDIMHTTRRSPEHLNDATNTTPAATSGTTGVSSSISSSFAQVPPAAKFQNNPDLEVQGESSQMSSSNNPASSKAKREMATPR